MTQQSATTLRLTQLSVLSETDARTAAADHTQREFIIFEAV